MNYELGSDRIGELPIPYKVEEIKICFFRGADLFQPGLYHTADKASGTVLKDHLGSCPGKFPDLLKLLDFVQVDPIHVSLARLVNYSFSHRAS